MTIATGEERTPELLAQRALEERAMSEVHSAAATLASLDMPLGSAVQMFETEFLEAMLKRCGKNQCEAADRLKVHRNTLARRIGDLGIDLSVLPPLRMRRKTCPTEISTAR